MRKKTLLFNQNVQLDKQSIPTIDLIVSNKIDSDKPCDIVNNAGHHTLPVAKHYKFAGRSFNRSSLIVAGVLGVLGLLAMAGGLGLLLSFRHILEFFVGKFLALKPDSVIFPMWKEPPLPIYLKVYMFNITNSHEFPWNNSKPVLEEVGPYVFREYWNRTNIQWFDNGTMYYSKLRTFEFLENMTVGSLDDNITSINVPALGVGQMAKTVGPWIRILLNGALRAFKEGFFVKKQVRQLLFEGYEDPLITAARQILGNFPFDKFGYFYGRNGSTTEQYTIYTGVGDMSRFTTIERYRNQTNLTAWGSDECNKIRGTDGSTHPPFLTEDRVIQIFAGDLCKTIDLGYKGQSDFNGIPAYAFEFKKENLDNGTLDPKNKCYCPDGQCLKSGVLSLKSCLMGNAPVALSLPHFYTADPSYLDAVGGLHPNETLHGSQFLLEPISGFPIKMNAKFQMNAMIERIPKFSFFDQVPNMVFPLLWFEQGGQMSDKFAGMFSDQLYKPFYYAHIFAYCCIGIGAALTITAVLYFVIARKQHTESHNFNNNDNRNY